MLEGPRTPANGSGSGLSAMRQNKHPIQRKQGQKKSILSGQEMDRHGSPLLRIRLPLLRVGMVVERAPREGQNLQPYISWCCCTAPAAEISVLSHPHCLDATYETKSKS